MGGAKGEIMPTCKICNRPIKGKGKTGLCYSCVHKTRNMKITKNKRCVSCGDPIADWNETGYCQKCQYIGKKGRNTNVPGKSVRVKIRCWNSHCRKWFYGRPDQHPRYSLCPACAAAKKLMSRNGRWTQDVMFSNSSE